MVVVSVAVGLPHPNVFFIDADHFDQDEIPSSSMEREYTWVAPTGEEVKLKYIADPFGGIRVLDSDIKFPEIEDISVEDK